MNEDKNISLPKLPSDEFTIRCPRLGHQINYSYCRSENDTPAKIYFKNEGVSPAGSHKPNTDIAQAYYNKVAGTKKITTKRRFPMKAPNMPWAVC